MEPISIRVSAFFIGVLCTFLGIGIWGMCGRICYLAMFEMKSTNDQWVMYGIPDDEKFFPLDLILGVSLIFWIFIIYTGNRMVEFISFMDHIIDKNRIKKKKKISEWDQ